MCLIKRSPIFFLSLLVFLLFFGISPAQAYFPFQGEVNTDDINIRADATINSEIISVVNKGEKVEVITQFYEWYKIKLPQSVSLYVKKEFLSCLDDQCALAKAAKTNINVRSSPVESAPIVGKLDFNEKVRILASKKGWYKIEAPQNSFGWINRKFINRVIKVR